MTVDGVGRDKIVTIEMLRHLRAARAASGEVAASSRSPEEGATALRPQGEPTEAAARRKARAAARVASGEGTAAPAGGAARRSPAASEQAELLHQYKEETRDLPEVRAEKVIEAKLRLSSGYYEREDVKREILRAVLANLQARGEASPSGTPELPEAADSPAGPAAPRPAEEPSGTQTDNDSSRPDDPDDPGDPGDSAGA